MKTSIKSIFLSVSVLAISLTLLTGCNTVKGFGQDVQQTGHTITGAAHSASH